MKKFISMLLTSSLVCLYAVSVSAQECFGTKIKEGGGFEMTSFDAKGKETGILHYKFTNVKQEGDYTVVDIELESFSNKGKSQYKQKFSMKCNGNESLVDASSLVMEDQLKSFESFNLKLTSNDIVYPSQFSVGQTLKDASLNGAGDMSGIPVTFDMNITDRKVVAQEKISVGAGEFDAYKITASNKMTNKTVVTVNIEFETIAYRAPGVLWDVKSETYRKGKLIARSELTKIY